MIIKARRSFSWFDRVILALNIALAFALVVCYLTPYLNPDRFPLVAVCGLFYLFICALNLCCIAYWLFRWYPLGLLSALCLLPAIGRLSLHFGFLNRHDNNADKTAAIRIVSYNLNSFIGIDRSSSSQPGIIKLVDSLKPDVLNVQELSSRVGGNEAIIDSFKRATGAAYHFSRAFIISNTDTTESVVFSKLPIVNTGTIPPPTGAPETQAIYVDVKKGDKIFRVYCLHLQSTHFEPEEHQAMSDVVHLRGFNLMEVKLIFTKLKVAYKKRSYQANTIKQYISKCPYPYVVTGDFNDTPSSYAVSKVAKGLKNSFVEKGSGYGVTYYRDFPSLQIDYIFTSQHFNIINHRIIQAKLSDHFPVISDMALK